MKRGLLATRSELANLRERLGRKPFDQIYETLQRRCALILESEPITEATWRSAQEQGRYGAATAATVAIQGRVFDLLVCHGVERSSACRDRAVEELKNLVGFSTWVDPCHEPLAADLCTGHACATVAVALDWVAEELSSADRVRCLRALRDKGLLPYLRAVRSGAFWHSCYHNWNAVVNGGVALAALLLADEEDAAMPALFKAQAGLRNFFAALGREGGWDEGLGYWGCAMRYVLLLGEALDRVVGDGYVFRQRGMDATGTFPIYFTPHCLPVSFGDLPLAPTWGVFYLLVKHYGLKEVAWWLDRYAFRDDAVSGGFSDAGLALLFRPLDWEREPAPDLRAVKAFNEIGWAAIADRWPLPTLYAALKTGNLSAHHAQLDMNSVQIAADGEILLHDPGSPEYSREYLSGEGRYQFHEVQSHSHNTVVVGDRGHRADAVGSIVEAEQAPTYRYVAGEAGAALGQEVRFVRHVVMPVAQGTQTGRMVIVLDEVRNAVPEAVCARWHTAGEVALAGDGKAGRIAGTSTALHFRLGGSGRLKVASDPPAGERCRDRVITVTTPPAREAVLACVFSRQPIPRLALRKGRNGDLVLQAGTLQLHWKPTRDCLHLEGVQGSA